jgi:hypothetical protein
VAQGVSPEVKPQYHKKKKKESKSQLLWSLVWGSFQYTRYNSYTNTDDIFLVMVLSWLDEHILASHKYTKLVCFPWKWQGAWHVLFIFQNKEHQPLWQYRAVSQPFPLFP